MRETSNKVSNKAETDGYQDRGDLADQSGGGGMVKVRSTGGQVVPCRVSSSDVSSHSSSAASAGRLGRSGSIGRVAAEKKAKKVRLYRNGDRYFGGMIYAVSSERYRTLDSLLEELTQSVICDRTVLPTGVRYLFSLDGTHRITSIDQLEDGSSYVCSATPVYRRLDYRRIESSLPRNYQRHTMTDEAAFRGHRDASLPPTRCCCPSQNTTSTSCHGLPSSEAADMDSFVRPRLITVIRNGCRPRKVVRVLLNRKTARSFDQVLNGITEAVQLDSGAVKKIFAIDGKPVTALQDFFREDNVFIACGTEKVSRRHFRLNNEELHCIHAGTGSQSFLRELCSVSPRRTNKTSRHPLSSSSTRSCAAVVEHDGEMSDNSQTTSSKTTSPLQSPRPGSASETNTRISRISDRSRSGVSRNRSSRSNGNHSDGDCRSTNNEPSRLRIKYKIGKVIGEGNFAVVKECTEKARKFKFALKIIDKKKCRGKEQKIENEVSILRRLRHNNIVQLIEDFDTPKRLYMIMEFVTGGDLFESISAATKYTERDASGMMFHVASAIHYLHSLNIVHRDIKPENLLVHERQDGTKSLKLGDFGLAAVVTEPLYTVCGTLTYVAPEVLAEVGYGLKVDIWSAGIIAYILLCGFPPFASEGNNREDLMQKIMAGRFCFIPPYWNEISNAAKELIKCLLKVDVDRRFTAQQLLEYPWVAEDTGRDNDLHSTVAKSIVQFAKNDQKNVTIHQSGVAVIATTALDKELHDLPEHRHRRS